MIPNHKRFIEAIKEKTKVCVRFYSIADSGVIDLVCAPLDYGPGAGVQDGVSRYWLWDDTSNTGSPTLGLLPEQVLDMRILGQVFDPAEFVAPPTRSSTAPEQNTTDNFPWGEPPIALPRISGDGPLSRNAADSSPGGKAASAQLLLASGLKPFGHERNLC